MPSPLASPSPLVSPMKRFPFCVFPAIFLLLCSLTGPGVFAAPSTVPASAVQWQRWEYALSAEQSHPDPYASVEVDVRFHGPNGAGFQVPAFWDGRGHFRFRAAFSSPGRWRWETTCTVSADAGLHGKTGEVDVSPYAGDNPLYRHGDLRVSGDRRFLTHADGTPFLWMGDTAWNAIWKSTMAEWRDYVDMRARQRFSVIQTIGTAAVPRSEIEQLPACGHFPFRDDGSSEPLYWQDLEGKIAYANARGLFVMLTGLGKSRGTFSAQQATVAFARYVAGRLAGDMVILSPSMDDRIDPLNENAGVRLRPFTTHLIAQHPGTHLPTARHFHDAAHTDFTALQTGHHNGRLEHTYDAAHAWLPELRQRPPVKPVINVEAMYDALGNDNGPAWREQDARKLGWISWLGGSPGYTYGAGDVPPKVPEGKGGMWRFLKDPTAYDHWRKAMLWPSAGQMTHLRDFFAGLEWWTLEPAPSRVLNQADEPVRKMVVSGTPDGKQLLAYLPDNAEIVLNLDGLAEGLTGRWFNPVSASYAPLAEQTVKRPTATLRRPDGWADAVLILSANHP